MEKFLGKDFLLTTDAARELFHGYAEDMPIVDYHCHIDPREIYENRRFNDIGEMWLAGDHYKWRLMRANGVDERYITGDAPYREKFQKFAEALPRAIGNPLVHWCHLELKNYFGYEGFLTGDTAEEVWQLCQEKIKNSPELSTRGLIKNSNVYMVGTTDDPCSDLVWHEKLGADDTFDVKVCPTFRPDPMVNIHRADFVDQIRRLEKAVGRDINTVDELCEALKERMDHFDAHGCRAADHGLDTAVFAIGSDKEIDDAFKKAMAGERVTCEEKEKYVTKLLLFCGREYARRGWVFQIHYSCLRNPNTRMFEKIGPDAGFDSMDVTLGAEPIRDLLDTLEREENLPKTILYSLNPGDNAMLDSLIGAFQTGGIPGKLQHGSAWWFNDTKNGMEAQLTSFADMGILGNFIGMLTDSRSFLSYARHEYFRRILCNWIGQKVENGEYPKDMVLLGGIVKDICFNNAKRYFNI